MNETKTKDAGANLRSFMAVHRLQVTAMAEKTGYSREWLTGIREGTARPSKDAQEAILAYLRESTGLPVPFEEIFSQ